MKDLIYYPSFEPTDLNWIKFAIIYLDSFSPIIPDSGNTNVSALFSKLKSETDLIKIRKPEWKQGNNASIKTINFLDLVEKHPGQYWDKFNSFDIIGDFKNKKKWTHKIYKEKFNLGFKEEMEQREYGTDVSGGILVSPNLANLYMTFLAEEIALDQQADTITDNPRLDNLSTLLRVKSVENEQIINAAITTTKLALPTNLEKISIGRLIEFRNQPSISELRSHYSEYLENYFKSLENDFDVVQFYNALEKTNLELTKEISLFFGGFISVGLGALILTSKSAPEILEISKSIAEGVTLSIGGTIGINRAWHTNDQKRKSRKFLTKLSNIK